MTELGLVLGKTLNLAHRPAAGGLFHLLEHNQTRGGKVLQQKTWAGKGENERHPITYKTTYVILPEQMTPLHLAHYKRHPQVILIL